MIEGQKKKRRRRKPPEMRLVRNGRVAARLAMVLAWQDLSQEDQRKYERRTSTLLELLRQVRP